MTKEWREATEWGKKVGYDEDDVEKRGKERK